MTTTVGLEVGKIETDATRNRFRSLTRVIVHDLVQPIRGVQQGAYRIIDATNRDDVRRIARQVAEDADLAEERVRALSRYFHATHLTEPRLELVSFEEVVSEAMTQVKDLAVTVEGDMTMTVPRILSHVVGNLLTNASKYSRADTLPQVRVEARRVRRFLRREILEIEVSDNGIGFDPDFADEIFKPFRRLEHEREGTGIGLAIVDEIVRQLGGRATATSEGEGKGATFRIRIPIRK